MSNEFEPNLSGADRELEAALASLSPDRSSGLDPIAAAFDAGRHDADRRMRIWQGASLLSGSLAAVVMIVAGMHSAAPRDAVHNAPIAIVSNDVTPFERPSDESILRLRQRVLAGGLDSLPPARVVRVPSLNPREIF
jgi:hypothetical protein